MLFRTLTKEHFRTLVEVLLQGCEVIGPKRLGQNVKGRPIHSYLPVGSFEELDLEYESTQYSAKTYFLPYRESLIDYRFEARDWTQSIHYRARPRALIGLHACDIHGLLKLDKVLIQDVYPSPYYVARRKSTLIIGIDHDPCEGGFCRSMGTDTVSRGFDLFLTDLGDRYFVSIASDQGFGLVQKVPNLEVTEEDRRQYRAVRKRIGEAFQPEVNTRILPNLLDIEFDSEAWQRWGQKCFSCGSCAMVCPTCYCFGVSESVSMDFRKGSKERQLYSCNLVDFAAVAGGLNFRPTAQSRLKYRYYHQHRGFVEAYDEPKCVGCNRCGRACLAGINPVDVIRDLEQAEERP